MGQTRSSVCPTQLCMSACSEIIACRSIFFKGPAATINLSHGRGMAAVRSRPLTKAATPLQADAASHNHPCPSSSCSCCPLPSGC
jgi:hypothetical protein